MDFFYSKLQRLSFKFNLHLLLLHLVGCVMSLCIPYVCIVCLRVFACISTWALGILKTCFINEPQIDKVTIYLVTFTTAL